MCNFEVEVRIVSEVNVMSKKEETVLPAECEKKSVKKFSAPDKYFGSFRSHGKCDRFKSYHISTLGNSGI